MGESMYLFECGCVHEKKDLVSVPRFECVCIKVCV